MSHLIRITTGIILVVLGLVLISLPLFFGMVAFASLIWGIPVLIIGVVIFFNKKEDEIEKIRFRKNNG